MWSQRSPAPRASRRAARAAADAADNWGALWRAGRFTDVMVTVEGRSFPAHKLVLFSGAEYFERLSDAEQFILTVTERGFGKRSSAYEYRTTGRGGKGIANIEMTERNGPVVASFPVGSTDQIMLVTDSGQLIRFAVDEVRIAGRRTQGVTLFRIEENERVVSVAHLSEVGDDEDADEEKIREVVEEIFNENDLEVGMRVDLNAKINASDEGFIKKLTVIDQVSGPIDAADVVNKEIYVYGNLITYSDKTVFSNFDSNDLAFELVDGVHISVSGYRSSDHTLSATHIGKKSANAKNKFESIQI